MEFDLEILPLIDSASLGCGLHAGSASETIALVRRCLELGVEIGAHPGYDDRANFGRLELGLEAGEIEALVRFQVGAMVAVAPIAYLKPHGALYHRCQSDRSVARRVVEVAAELGVDVVGQPGLGLLTAAAQAGVPGRREAFADRCYLPDGTLAPRSEPGAVLELEAAVEQALRLAVSGRFDTICIHGDSPHAVEIAGAIRSRLLM